MFELIGEKTSAPDEDKLLLTEKIVGFLIGVGLLGRSALLLCVFCMGPLGCKVCCERGEQSSPAEYVPDSGLGSQWLEEDVVTYI